MGIKRRGTIYTITGKWVQISADKELHTVKACGQAASTWERLAIGYNEGMYTGEWSNGMLNGWGRLDYIDYNGDEKFYKFFYGDKTYNALYYEGNFSDGARWGNGTVVYEDGWKEEGTFYGAWVTGNVSLNRLYKTEFKVSY